MINAFLLVADPSVVAECCMDPGSPSVVGSRAGRSVRVDVVEGLRTAVGAAVAVALHCTKRMDCRPHSAPGRQTEDMMAEEHSGQCRSRSTGSPLDPCEVASRGSHHRDTAGLRAAVPSASELRVCVCGAPLPLFSPRFLCFRFVGCSTRYMLL